MYFFENLGKENFNINLVKPLFFVLQTEQGYAVPPPEGSGFSPPKDIQTIYVPPENAINIPDSFGVDVGSSFGYQADQSSQLAISPASSSFSFDNPAFNAPQVNYNTKVLHIGSKSTANVPLKHSKNYSRCTEKLQ